MRFVLQRVKFARVEVQGRAVAAIDQGILVLVGFGQEDEDMPAAGIVLSRMARKLVQVRIFPNESDRLDLSVADVGGQVLAVSQFTLHADCRKGRRPSLHDAAEPQRAARLFDAFAAELEHLIPGRVQTGSFGEEMDVILHNWGPLTLIWDSQTL
ncbi:D-tyrosyl-tRNA(Tyr) deacylase [Desulfonatronum thiosulfatophilum]|uniref:D-aminoacyl-tRNA deacylase n=1 Tax=Desulfonatronum thiosulfatophilum TaxID=617002 RepID=A0A1G6C9E5_9BACT|nr:D-aminoacyl-tRNA deacylase [Desulfonatronum thiosulfatophilum]SDB29476.1 D-tyrosyl-tRNA(Tyr) deacylase [Desulfonatronum thiosulfatophilum]